MAEEASGSNGFLIQSFQKNQYLQPNKKNKNKKGGAIQNKARGKSCFYTFYVFRSVEPDEN